MKNTYVAEMGGAMLTISVTYNDKIRTLKRTYQEPGMSANVREYSNICIEDGRISAGNLKGKVVDDGLLIIEEKPNIDGIPNNLWVFYKSK